MLNGRIWPNGKFGIGFYSRRFLPDPVKPYRQEDGNTIFMREQVKEYGIEAVIQAASECKQWNSLRGKCEENEEQPPLGLSNAPNLKKSARGQNGISAYGRLLVDNAVFMLESRYGTERMSFATFTLPPMTLEANRYVVQQWPQICNHLRVRLTQELKRAGLPPHIVGVTELQEKRFVRTPEFVGLHIHLVFVGRKQRGTWAIAPKRLQQIWMDCVTAVSASLADECKWDASTNIQRVNRSARAYLGKYMSKGVKTLALLKRKRPDVKLPATWYICTRQLMQTVKEKTLTSNAQCERLFALWEADPEKYVKWCKRIELTLADGTKYPVGWAGQLTELGRSMLDLPYSIPW